jgi:hypothetical protein
MIARKSKEPDARGVGSPCPLITISVALRFGRCECVNVIRFPFSYVILQILADLVVRVTGGLPVIVRMTGEARTEVFLHLMSWTTNSRTNSEILI